MKKDDDRVYITDNDLEQLIIVLTQSRDCFAIIAKFICDFLSESKATEIHQTIYTFARIFFDKEERLNQQLRRLGINTEAEDYLEESNKHSKEQQNEQQKDPENKQSRGEYNPQIVNETGCLEINLLNFFIQSKLNKMIPEQIERGAIASEYG